MSLYIKDETTAQLVTDLAKLKGLTKQDAARLAGCEQASENKPTPPAIVAMNCIERRRGDISDLPQVVAGLGSSLRSPAAPVQIRPAPFDDPA